jgi:hypothetical protein
MRNRPSLRHLIQDVEREDGEEEQLVNFDFQNSSFK